MSLNNEEHFVYHATTLDRAERCIIEGIIPSKSSEGSANSLEMDIAFDAARPKAVEDLNVSRQGSVYAHTNLENALSRKNGGWLHRVRSELAVLSILLPCLEDAYVCDGLLNVPPHTPEEYWASFTSLADYQGQETPTFVGPHFKPYSNKPTRFVYMWPEVLLPGRISPDNISVVTSHLKGSE